MTPMLSNSGNNADLPPHDWPGRAISRMIPTAKHLWHTQVHGQGPDLLLLHGAGGSLHSWSRVVPHFTDRYRVITVDLPCHGFTRGPRGRSSLADMAHDIVALMHQEGWHPRVLIGHSAGAAITLEIARQAPDQIDRVVAINAALENFQGLAGWAFPLMAKMLSINPFMGILVSWAPSSHARARGILHATGARLDDDAIELYARLLQRRSHVEGTLAMMAQWSLDMLTAALPSIETPTLFIHGENDVAVPIGVVVRAANNMPNAHVIRLPGVGHLAQEETPDRVVQEIRAFIPTSPDKNTRKNTG